MCARVNCCSVEMEKGTYLTLLTYLCLIIAGGRRLYVVGNDQSAVTPAGASAVDYEDSVNTSHIEESCIQHCPDQNRTNTEHIDCGRDCYIAQCTAGCRLWEAALEKSCKVVCNKTDQEESKELYCAMGCNNALNRYFSWIIDEVGTPSAPALVADSLTATSLSLEWEIPPRLAKFTKGSKSYLVQWRFEQVRGDWKFCRNHSIGDNSTVRVDNLQPYTKYRFRVALILSSNHEKELFSEQSVIISTLPEGTPLSEPAIVRAVAVDHTRISVSWEPGPFPNGPILSYVLKIKDLSSTGYLTLKDIPATEHFDLIDKLTPQTEYHVSVRMINANGQGPAAHTSVRTPAAPYIANPNPKITLILGAEDKVATLGTNLLADAQIIYDSNSRIQGIAIHIARKLLFVSDSSQSVYKASLEQPNGPRATVLQSTEVSTYSPMDLSMDWLNDHLYMLMEVKQSVFQVSWQISRCDLDGSNRMVVLAGLRSKPSHFEVDPFNGYLFWTFNGTPDDGLYRLDLADVGVKPFRMSNASGIGSFVLDYTSFKILLPSQNNTVISMDLEGKRIEAIRSANNTQSPMYGNVKSIDMANNLFYWTDGIQLMNEELHHTQKRYYNNKYPNQFPNVLFLRINVSSAQPIPVPVNAPIKVQALLSTRRGKVSWHIPNLLGFQGKGAWQNWNYELEITNEDELNQTINVSEISGSHYVVNELRPSTNYKFRVAAYTSAGRGPWSSEFRTRTIKTPHDRYMIWSSNEGLVQSDILGEHIHELIPRSKIGNQSISDIAWYEDVVYFVVNNTLRFYNRTSYVMGRLKKLDSVQIQSIAIDWIGPRLYWYNLDKQVIYRANLSGFEHEPLVSVSSREIDFKIDAIRGFLYYSNGHAVEYCRLNGKHKREYYRVEKFSGKQVMGLTLDMDNQRVYWIVRGYDFSSLFSAQMADQAGHHSILPHYEYKTEQDKIQGPLNYFSDRLLWLQDERTVIVGNMTGKNLAHIRNPKLSGLKSFTIIDPTHHAHPNVSGRINVIPNSINVSSIVVNGTWNSFTINWAPITSVNYGEVFYDIRFLNIINETTLNWVRYSNDSLQPYTSLEFSIQASTYWAKSELTKINLTSPAAQPSQPTNPRVFLTQRYNPFEDGLNLVATFRWSPPADPNGPITSYKIFCWFVEDDQNKTVEDGTIGPSDKLEKTMKNLVQNVTYYFRVQAASTVDIGELSEEISIHTSSARPVPRVLVSSGEEILLVDLDTQHMDVVVNTGSPVRHMAYVANERRLLWINENNELISYNHQNKMKLATCTGQVLALTVDWVQRLVYWSQSEGNDGSAIYFLDMFKFENEKSVPQLILRRPGTIWSLVIYPLDQHLFWVETKSNTSKLGTLYSYSIVTSYIETFFKDQESIKKTLLLDTGSIEDSSLIWSDASDRLYQTNLMHRNRRPMHTNLRNNSFASHLVKDSGRMYWTENGSILSKNLNSVQHEMDYEMKVPSLLKLLAFNDQIYPNKKCLMPKQDDQQYTPSLLEATERTLRLQLPKPALSEDCSNTLAGTKYTIRFKRMQNNVNGETNQIPECVSPECQTIISFDDVTDIVGLSPFVKYVIQVGVNNYYGEKFNRRTILGPMIVFSTAIGAPSVPRNITAQVISPTEAIVQWLPPLELNADLVWYEVHWLTQLDSNGVKNQQFVKEHKQYSKQDQYPISINISKLLPNQLYSISVKASTSNTTYNQSESVHIRTLAEPDNIVLHIATPYSLQVYWAAYNNISKYVLEYQELNVAASPLVVFDSELSNISNSFDMVNNIYTIENLQPKCRYRFSIQLFFSKRDKPYTWPPDSRFVFETLGDRPSAPGKPQINNVREKVYKVVWEPAKENGATIVEYSLEAWKRTQIHRVQRSIDDDQFNVTTAVTAADQPAYSDVQTFGDHYTRNVQTELGSVPELVVPAENWTVHYNGTDTYWIVVGDEPITDLSFRVRARNLYGWGSYSKESDAIQPNNEQVSGRRDLLLIVVFVPVLAILLILFLCCAIYVLNRKVADKKNFQEASVRVPDVELANLRDMPRGGNLIHSNNILYSQGPLTDADIALLPQIRRDQIIMNAFLGSGQFGDVYEGTVRNADDESETRVAIKTLKKGATEQDKGEFLQEAQLMSNFKHQHILRLIGVCFHSDELYIIMELMQGGDLQVFLRQSRPSANNPSSLTLLDLISMCVDIASGCRYLEEMHFVHRDLACRNCLVSSVEPENRVVKIGDFGLARDIYKNDYYRKDGEGLLPVRWMSPESLVDGVFTSQSDIWAFGVLCWEIMTLGQQPYPARNNLEVLQYVRDGGRLTRPVDCPEELYQLMLKCWSYRPEDRPTFGYCLEVLTALKDNNSDATHITSQNLNRLHNGGIFNRSYLLADENHNHNTGGMLKISSEGHDLVEPPPIVTPTSSTASPTLPKYLDLIYNESDEPISQLILNGYEIPLPDCGGTGACNRYDCCDGNTESNTNSLSSNNEHQRHNNHKLHHHHHMDSLDLSPTDKERTFSSSSTVSESSLNPAVLLKVALPNSKEECSSNEALLSHQPVTSSDKLLLRPFYTNAKAEEVLKCDGKTMM